MQYHDAIKRLQVNKRIIVDLTAGISQERAIWKPADDRWSVLEVVCHLVDIEIEDFRTDFDIVLHHPDQSWPSFNIEEWVIDRKYNERDISASLKAFGGERDKSVTWLSSLENPDLDTLHSGNGFDHGRMSAGDVLVSWLAHDLGHIRQLALLRWEMLNHFEQPYNPAYSGFTV